MTGTGENILVVALEQREVGYRARLKDCRRESSEGAVHDLRIAARRLLAVLDIVRALDAQLGIQKTRRYLKDQLDELDDLRDVQVMVGELRENLPRVPELVLFQPYLQKREKRLLRTARERAEDSHGSRLRTRLEKLRAALARRVADAGFNASLLQVVDRAYATAHQAYDQLDVYQPPSLHKLRIAFRKFRYMTEIVTPLFPAPPESYFKRLHDYQGAMGDIRDITIFLAALADFTGEDADSLDSKSIRRYFERRLDGSIAAFLEDKGKLHTFWRPAPDQPFPWEKSNDPVQHPTRDRRSGGPQRGRRRQPAPADRQGQPEDVPDRPGPASAGNAD